MSPSRAYYSETSRSGSGVDAYNVSPSWAYDSKVPRSEQRQPQMQQQQQSYPQTCYANRYDASPSSMPEPKAPSNAHQRHWRCDGSMQPQQQPRMYMEPTCDAPRMQQQRQNHMGTGQRTPYDQVASPAKGGSPQQCHRPELPPFDRSDLAYMHTTLEPGNITTWKSYMPRLIICKIQTASKSTKA